MPRGGTIGNRGGQKGRSGRRTKSEEQRRRDVIQKAWDNAGIILNGKKLLEQQFDMSKSIVVKSMPEQVEHSGAIKLDYGHRQKPQTQTEALPAEGK